MTKNNTPADFEMKDEQLDDVVGGVNINQSHHVDPYSVNIDQNHFNDPWSVNIDQSHFTDPYGPNAVNINQSH